MCRIHSLVAVLFIIHLIACYSYSYHMLVLIQVLNVSFMGFQPVLKRERPIRLPKPSRPRDVRTECATCTLPGSNANLVR